MPATSRNNHAAGFVQRARLLWQTSFDAFAVVDDTRRYLRVNPAACALFGTDAGRILGARIEDFTPSDQWPELERLWRVLLHRSTLGGPYEMLRADGVRTVIEFRAAREFGPGETLIVGRELIRGLPPRDTAAADGGPAELTTREREILQLAADGAASSTEIARILVLSPQTVRTHFRNACRKLDVSGRAPAVAAALRAGLID
jgi:PAS domain S-box-containing protein